MQNLRLQKVSLFLALMLFSLTAWAQVGSVDCTFNNGSEYGKITTDFNGFHDMGNTMKVYRSGIYLDYIVITGSADHTDGKTEMVGVARYKPNGTLDTTFGGDGKVITNISSSTYDRGRAIALYPDGKIVVAVSTSTSNLTVVRYLSNGSLDTSFGSGGVVSHSIGTGHSNWSDMEIQNDGKIILVGQKKDGSNYKSVVIRLNFNGSIDSAFEGNDGVGVDLADNQFDDKTGFMDYGMESFSKVKIDSNGNIWTCGWARQIEGASKTNRATFARISSTGSVLASTVVNLGYGSESCGGIDLVGTTHAYIGGYTNNSDDKRDLGIAKLAANGSFDTSFGGNGKTLVDMGGSDEFRGVAVQADGKIVVTSNTLGDFAVARLNIDGTLDTSFSDDGINLIDFGDDDRPYGGVQLQSTGAIILAGWSGSSEERNFAVTRVIAKPTEMAFCGITVDQNTLPIEPVTTGDILSMNIEVSGTLNPFSASDFNFTTAGTDDTSDIQSAQLFYTGSSNTYSETNSLGSYSAPDGSFTFTAYQALQPGKNYFWMAYGIPGNITFGNLVDASASQVTVNGNNILLNSAPYGSRRINYIAFFEDFGEEDGAAFPAGWTNYDQDGDGNLWTTAQINGFGSAGRSGAGAGSESYTNKNLTPDNWIVSPVIDLTDYKSATLEYWIGAIHDEYGKENIEVYVSTYGNTPADFTSGFGASVDSYTTSNMSWLQRTVDLSAYAGQAFYIAWRHNQNHVDQNWGIRLDNISVTGEKIIENQAPTLSSFAKAGSQDTDINFAVSDFSGAFSDPDGNSMAKIKIISLPSHGTLEHNGSTFSVPLEIDPSGFGTFVYKPAPGYVGADSFKWNASDGKVFAAADADVNFTLKDNQSPVISNCPTDINVNVEGGTCEAVANWTAPAATDNVGVANFTSSHNSGDTYPLGKTTVTYTAEDAAGKSSLCSFNITVKDSEKPTITCPSDMIVNSENESCGKVVTFTAPVGTDNCGGSSTVKVVGPISGATYPKGATTHTYKVTDASGNSAECSFKVTVEDATNPTATCPADQTVELDNTCSAKLPNYKNLVTSGDNCDASLSAEQAPAAETVVKGAGTEITVTEKMTDDDSNFGSCSFKVTAVDNIKPAITCPSDITVDNDTGACGAVVNFTEPEGTDNCGASTARTVGLAPGSTFPVGTTTQTYVVTDGSTNSAQCSFKIIVKDSEKPKIACSLDKNEPYQSATKGAIVEFDDPQIADNCPGATFTQDSGLASGSEFPVGTTENGFSATDASGNTAVCSFKVDVATPLVVVNEIDYDSSESARGEFIELYNAGTEPINLDPFVLKLVDDTIYRTIELPDFELESGKYYVICSDKTVVENCDLEVESADDFIRNGESDSVAINLANVIIDTVSYEGNAAAPYTETEGVSEGDTDSIALASISRFPDGTDTGNNKADFRVTVPTPGKASAENSRPTTRKITEVIDQDSELRFYFETFTAAYSDPDDQEMMKIEITSLPEHGKLLNNGAEITQFPIELTESVIDALSYRPDESFAGSDSFKWKASDGMEWSEAETEVRITINDTEKPEFANCPENIDLSNNNDSCSVNANWTVPTATDNVAVVSFASDHQSGETFLPGTTTVTYAAKDAAGNSSKCVFNVTINNKDSDNDGTPDCTDECDSDPEKTVSGICGCGIADTDTDGDKTVDCKEECDNDPAKTIPGICGCGIADTDTDKDGTADCIDNCVNDAAKTVPGICGCGIADTDTDKDGTADCNDKCVNDGAKTEPGICGCGTADTDTDKDGTADCNDKCVNDAAKIEPGICGCGTADTDTDGDKTADCNDQCVNDSSKIVPGICGCGIADTDTDQDGTADCNDKCVNDSSKTVPGICGCGTADTDTDKDGTADCNDQCVNDAAKTVPGICGCGTADTDTDGDKIADCIDNCVDDSEKTEPGICGCGIADTDKDKDGTPDCNDQCVDDSAKIAPGVCGCGVAESDIDSDKDGTPDCIDQCANDSEKTEPGICGCGKADVDTDGDGTEDCNDLCEGHDDRLDADGDGKPDGCDKDFSGSCASTIEITEIPFDQTINTTDRTPHLASYGYNCGETEQAGAEIVYEYTAVSDVELEITLTPDSKLDAAIRLIETCEENNDCLGSVDEGTAGEVETLNYTIEEGETIFIVVEQISETSGEYDITVKEAVIETDDDTNDEDADETVDEKSDEDEIVDEITDKDSGKPEESDKEKIDDEESVDDELTDIDLTDEDIIDSHSASSGCGCSLLF